MDREKEEKLKKAEEEREDLGRELRYTQQVVASELAGWQEWRAKTARRAVKDLARNMVVQERARLESMKRALRRLNVEVDNADEVGTGDTSDSVPIGVEIEDPICAVTEQNE